MDGISVYMQLEEQNCQIPTIISTSYYDRDYDKIDELLAKSELRTLCKPYEPIEILAAIEEINI